jgi:hypothetical protein
MMPPKPPLVIRSSGDVFFCRSIEAAERELEAVDVRHGEYTGYDRDGRLLLIDVITETVPIFFGLGTAAIERVRIGVAEKEPTHMAEARAAVLGYLDRIGIGTRGMSDLTLAELIVESQPYVEII